MMNVAAMLDGMRASYPALACGVLALSGCHSAYIEASIVNHSSQPISLIEVDYPSASFGTQALAVGAEFHYRFKVLGSGEVKLLYTDARQTEQVSKGPTVSEGDEGRLSVTVGSSGAEWKTQLTRR